jgi:PncC family amidohydrolase
MDNQTGSIASTLFRKLKEQKLKIAFSESMSGGLLCGGITRIPGASSVLLGGVVTYDAEAKIRLLGVSPQLLERFGAESREVSEAMVLGLKKLFPEADVFVAITGSASVPVNDYRISSPPGTAFLSFFKNGESDIISQTMNIDGSREEVLDEAVQRTYSILTDYLNSL